MNNDISERLKVLEEEKAKYEAQRQEIFDKYCAKCPRLQISHGCEGCDIKVKREELRKRIVELDNQIRELKEQLNRKSKPKERQTVFMRIKKLFRRENR
jgi:uncharacterized small protein (DUF1192 family)